MVIVPEFILKKLYLIKGAQGALLTGSRVLNKVSKNADWDFFVL